MRDETRAKLWLVGLFAAPLGLGAVLCVLAWSKAHDVGEPCTTDSECHDILGDRCLTRVCSPTCEHEPCPAGWECVEASFAGDVASQLRPERVCQAPEPLRPGSRRDALRAAD